MKILIAGDLVPNHRMAQMACDGGFRTLLNNMLPYTEVVDFGIVNLEAPVVKGTAKRIRKSGPALKTNEEVVRLIKNAGFDAVTLANNHFRDYGQIGVEDTLDTLDAAHIDHVGGGRAFKEAKRPLIKEFDGEKVAIVNVCEHEFSVATERYGGSNPIDVVGVYQQIRLAKERANFVLLITHGGHEHFQYPSPRMKKWYRFFVDVGADAVVNHHQHCFSGYEMYNCKPIFYGLGNFCFDKKGRSHTIWNEGYWVVLDFCNNKIGFEIVPYSQCEEEVGVFPMDGKRKDDFWKRIEEINTVIADDERHHAIYEEFLEQKKREILTVFGPTGNRYVNALIHRKLLSSLLSKGKAAEIYNYLSCEAHRDISVWALAHYIKTYS